MSERENWVTTFDGWDPKPEERARQLQEKVFELTRQLDEARADAARLRAALEEIAAYDTDWTINPYANVTKLQAMAERALTPTSPAPAVPTLDPLRLRDDQWLRGWLHRFALEYVKRDGNVTKELDQALDGIGGHIDAQYRSLSRTPPAPVTAPKPRDTPCARCGCARCGHHPACEGAGGNCGCERFVEPAPAPVTCEECEGSGTTKAVTSAATFFEDARRHFYGPRCPTCNGTGRTPEAPK